MKHNWGSLRQFGHTIIDLVVNLACHTLACYLSLFLRLSRVCRSTKSIQSAITISSHTDILII